MNVARASTPEWLKPRGDPWRSESGAQTVHANPWFTVEQHDAVAPTGARTPYFVHRYRNLSTGVVPLHDDGTVTLVGQWRFPLGRYGWELPEGGASPGEQLLDACKRELREEAGLEAADWREILTLELSNASTDETSHVYLAQGLTLCPVAPEPTEEFAVARVPFREALGAVMGGQLKDAITVAALLRVHLLASMGELKPELARLITGG